jgi:hypothetical protein
MKGHLLIYRPYQAAPLVEQLNAAPDLEALQAAVGGYIEAVPGLASIAWPGTAPVPCVAFCNEDGKGEGEPINNQATLLWDAAMRRLRDDAGRPLYPNGLLGRDGLPADVLVGSVAVIVGDAELLAAL